MAHKGLVGDVSCVLCPSSKGFAVEYIRIKLVVHLLSFHLHSIRKSQLEWKNND